VIDWGVAAGFRSARAPRVCHKITWAGTKFIMARRISILTIGTLGDISPMTVLGLALKRAGYDVSIAVPENFRSFVEDMGLPSRRCGADFSSFMRAGEMTSLAGASTVQVVRKWLSPGPEMRDMFEGIFRDAVEATADADAIIFHPLTSIACDIAEAKGIPAILVPLGMVSPSAESLLSVIPGTRLPAWNRHSYKTLRLQRLSYASVVNEIRTKVLGLRRTYFKHPHHVAGRRVPVLYPVSPVLQPRPNEDGDQIHFTGYWFRDGPADWRPTGRLAEFLSRGPQPIYIGFGSMPGLGLERTEMILRACEAANQRAILGRGWGAFGEFQLSENFHLIDYAPHDQLFREVRAVVHHGGLGTTSSGLRAGRPTLICPFMLDQKYWGHQVVQLGVGPEFLQIQHWSVESLTAAIRDLVANRSYAARAAEIGAAMSQENGTARAVEIVGEIVGSPLPATELATC
jgi:sterol 3beta-glucosyltransferase